MSLENVKNVLLILSGKGGVGKSSITIQLALSLCLAGKSVGILDVDLTGPSIPRLLGLENAKIKQAPGGWLPVEVHASQILPPLVDSPLAQNGSAAPSAGAASEPHPNGSSPETPKLTAMENGHAIVSDAGNLVGSLCAISLAFLLPSRSSAVVWRGPKKTAMVRQFLTDVLWPAGPSGQGLDYLLIDTPPGTSDEHISLAETLLSATNNLSASSISSPDPSKPNLAGAVVVTTPQAISIADVKKELNFCRKTAIPVIGVVENMAGFVCECCGEETNLFGKGGGEVMAQEFGVKFLGRVALDAQWGRLVEEGRRPRYGEVVRQNEGGGAPAEEEALQGNKVDEGLLVDKYRSCGLRKAMNGITKQVINVVDASKT